MPLCIATGLSHTLKYSLQCGRRSASDRRAPCSLIGYENWVYNKARKIKIPSLGDRAGTRNFPRWVHAFTSHVLVVLLVLVPRWFFGRWWVHVQPGRRWRWAIGGEVICVYNAGRGWARLDEMIASRSTFPRGGFPTFFLPHKKLARQRRTRKFFACYCRI